MKPYKDYFVLKAGSTTGSVCASVKVETKVNNPSLDKINKIIEKSKDFFNDEKSSSRISNLVILFYLDDLNSPIFISNLCINAANTIISK